MKQLALLLITSTLAVTACGPKDKDPLNDERRQEINTAKRKPSPKVDQTPLIADQRIQTQLFSIDPLDNLYFEQGSVKKVVFQARNSFGPQNPVDVNLEMTKGPKGAKFRKVDLGWELSWTPASDLLADYENYKEYDLDIDFKVLPSSSPQALMMMDGLETTTSFSLFVLKDSSFPLIEHDVDVTEKFDIEFVVALKGGTSDDLRIDRLRGPEAPTRELTQMDATHGTFDHPRLVKSLGKDAEGRKRYKFSLNFDKDQFLAAFFKKLKENPVLQSRYEKGEIKSTEATLNLEAVNEYNAQRSPAISVNFKVPLPEFQTAGEES